MRSVITTAPSLLVGGERYWKRIVNGGAACGTVRWKAVTSTVSRCQVISVLPALMVRPAIAAIVPSGE